MLLLSGAGGFSTVFLKDKGVLSNILLPIKKKSILPLHFLCCTLTNILGQIEVFADETTNNQLKSENNTNGEKNLRHFLFWPGMMHPTE